MSSIVHGLIVLPFPETYASLETLSVQLRPARRPLQSMCYVMARHVHQRCEMAPNEPAKKIGQKYQSVSFLSREPRHRTPNSPTTPKTLVTYHRLAMPANEYEQCPARSERSELRREIKESKFHVGNPTFPPLQTKETNSVRHDTSKTQRAACHHQLRRRRWSDDIVTWSMNVWILYP